MLEELDPVFESRLVEPGFCPREASLDEYFLPDVPCLEVALPCVRLWPLDAFLELVGNCPAIAPPGVYPWLMGGCPESDENCSTVAPLCVSL